MAMDSFLCWKLKVATMAVAIYVIISGSIAALMELFDIIAQADDNFDIIGGFKARWRMHVWEGWLATNIVMFVLHLILIAYSGLMIAAIRRFPTYYEFNLTKAFLGLLIVYFIAELGVTCYRYSWYGPNTFRLGYLIFSFLFWMLRSILLMICCFVVHSRIKEVDYEIHFGEKKIFSKFLSEHEYDGMHSGYSTPMMHSGPSMQSSSYA